MKQREKRLMSSQRGYHQIQMAEGDEDKTDLFIGKGLFCYQKMPFGLKNAWEPIKANPPKVKEITDLKPPKTLKEIQSLNGKLVALSRFLSKSADKSLEFFKALKRCTDKKTVQWTADAEGTFPKMMEFIEILPKLTSPIKGKVLVMYLEASTKSISEVLLTEREKRQVLIYFISKAHPISVLTDKPIKKILARPEKSGSIANEVLIEVLAKRLIVQREVSDIIKEEGETWMLPIQEFLGRLGMRCLTLTELEALAKETA
ncbi:hypothetical protein Tco_0876380 [Tanacetum coccineum]|uniref:Reverse transcriptase/retrotransposon-derived protein RNase H-like domain-containing protein n=1 Tax=Tanacetum coccineum TaxID=301880 RepID=A0ABQ5BTS7_9ASTR